MKDSKKSYYQRKKLLPQGHKNRNQFRTYLRQHGWAYSGFIGSPHDIVYLGLRLQFLNDGYVNIYTPPGSGRWLYVSIPFESPALLIKKITHYKSEFIRIASTHTMCKDEVFRKSKFSRPHHTTNKE